MRKLLLILSLLYIPIFSHAVVADAFNCHLQLNDYLTGEESSQDLSFNAMRLPLSQSPSPDVRITGSDIDARIQLKSTKREMVANVTFDYHHAVRLGSQGEVTEARQFTCIAIQADYCDLSQSGGGGIAVCQEGKMNCMQPPPFDPVYGWAPVPFYGNIPTFNEHALGLYTQPVKNDSGVQVGLASFSCEFKGTYE